MSASLEPLRAHQRIGLDTSIFIYLLEDIPIYADITETILDELVFGRQQGDTSVLSLVEFIVRPLMHGRTEDADEYIHALRQFPDLEIVEITDDVALRAAALRAKYRFATPDALQVAACLMHGATAFVTNDRRLRRIEELQITMLDDLIERRDP